MFQSSTTTIFSQQQQQRRRGGKRTRRSTSSPAPCNWYLMTAGHGVSFRQQQLWLECDWQPRTKHSTLHTQNVPRFKSLVSKQLNYPPDFICVSRDVSQGACVHDSHLLAFRAGRFVCNYSFPSRPDGRWHTWTFFSLSPTFFPSPGVHRLITRRIRTRGFGPLPKPPLRFMKKSKSNFWTKIKCGVHI